MVEGNNTTGATTTSGQITKKLAMGESTKSIVILSGVFLLSSVILASVYYTFPELDPSEKQYFRLPRSYDDALNLGRVLERYTEKYYFQVISAMICVYIFLQTFAIPGSIFLSVLSGFLYPFAVALGLVCFCSATGASFCYLLSQYLGRKLVYKYFPDRANKYAVLVRNHKDDLLSYIIFLRITPFLPNWFINIAAPVVDVPLVPFYIGTFLGVAPPSFVAIQGGKSLHELTKSGNTMSLSSVILLAVFATISLIPVFLRTRLRAKFD
ncbi:transmembrane protein 41B isoform X1 [Bemisia tabaci]|uniref:transmembrane protein 41B isoform X1 n=1 Tax=Bemisia tabaci TaxID=7038 RepID=UPI0008F9923B|nr:PREDICTED: transmembrane protein 41B isoform X1 [Bemisia tabaci]